MKEQLRELAPEEFPGALTEIPDPPKILYARGALPGAGTTFLAVVGSRAATRYGLEATASLIHGLAGYPISIVSGLALGIDSAAHRAALHAGLHTIALPGSGLSDEAITPRTNVRLAHDILSAHGLLLSERPATYLPHPYDFPLRNRLMVGIADAVLMIEAGQKSGTLITARLASEYNRDLLAVPHRIGDPHGYGAHLFIRLGATLISEPTHILEALNLTEAPSVSLPLPALTSEEQTVYEALQEPAEKDELLRRITLPSPVILGALVSLELKGVVKETYGLWRQSR